MAVPVPDSDRRRLENLERLVAQLKQEIRGLRDVAQAQPAPNIHLARTRGEAGEEEEDPQVYPDESTNTFGLEYLDVDFVDDAAGEISPLVEERSDEIQAYAHFPWGNFVLPGHPVLALKQRNGKVLMIPLPTVRLKIKTDEIIPTGDDGGMATVWAGGVATAAKLRVYLDWAHGGEQIDAEIQGWAYWSYDQQRWIVDAADCNPEEEEEE